MKVTLDGKELNFNEKDKNIVDLAAKNGIGIPAPCYKTERKKGCCNACVVEIDGKEKFACATKPKDGMNIILNRPDLKKLRKERIKEYENGIKTGSPCGCSGSSDCC